MPKVYILGAGASKFAGLPLANELYEFLKPESYQNINFGIREGVDCFIEVYEKIRDKFKKDRNSIQGILEELNFDGNSLDVEMILTILDLIDDKPELSELNIPEEKTSKARGGFSMLVTSSFQGHACDNLYGKIYKNKSRNLNDPVNDFSRIIYSWAQVLKKGDIIVTFNWDMLQEMILWGAKKWNYQDGYGFPYYQDIQIEPFEPSQVLIFKLHGSINWALWDNSDRKIFLDYVNEFFPESPIVFSEIGRPLGATSDYGASLITPSYLKNPKNNPALAPIWNKSTQFIKEAEEVIVIGYSLPKADIPTRNMLSEAFLNNPQLRTIKIVGNKKSSNWLEFCESLGKTSEFVSRTFEEFVRNV